VNPTGAGFFEVQGYLDRVVAVVNLSLVVALDQSHTFAVT